LFVRRHDRQQLAGGLHRERGRQILLDRDLLAVGVEGQIDQPKAARCQQAHDPVAADHGDWRQGSWPGL